MHKYNFFVFFFFTRRNLIQKTVLREVTAAAAAAVLHVCNQFKQIKLNKFCVLVCMCLNFMTFHSCYYLFVHSRVFFFFLLRMYYEKYEFDFFLFFINVSGNMGSLNWALLIGYVFNFHSLLMLSFWDREKDIILKIPFFEQDSLKKALNI